MGDPITLMKVFHCSEINFTIPIKEFKQRLAIHLCEAFGGTHKFFYRDNRIAVQIVDIKSAWQWNALFRK